MSAKPKPIETREPTVLEAGKQLGKAVVRSLSFKRRRRATTGTQTVMAIEVATDPMDATPAARDTATPAAPRQPLGIRRRSISFTFDSGTAQRPSMRRGDSVPALPPRASKVREAVCLLADRASSSVRRSSRLSLGPPRASEIRAAMQPLYGNKTEPTLGLTRSPTQPELVASVVKRASVGGIAFRAARVERRRERRLAHFMHKHDCEFITPPPRASDVARAVGGLEM